MLSPLELSFLCSTNPGLILFILYLLLCNAFCTPGIILLLRCTELCEN
uniref:Uncharacterized protein n=1 Tax=Arundo donax TaxID=35708 RepID=A0A0A9FY49_ARUDO